MVNKNSLKSCLKQALRIRRPYITIRFFKIYSNELYVLKQQNYILDYKVINLNVTIFLNLNAKL